MNNDVFAVVLFASIYPILVVVGLIMNWILDICGVPHSGPDI